MGAPIHNREEKMALLELANHWMQLAVQSEGTAAGMFSPREHRGL